MSDKSDDGSIYGIKFETTLETTEGEEISDAELGERVLSTTLEDLERGKKEHAVVREIYRKFVAGVKKRKKLDAVLGD